MIKSTLITFILFCSTIGFAQNSDTRIKETTPIASKAGLGESPQTPRKEETIGTTPMINLGTPTLMPNNGSSGENDQKNGQNVKNATKPH